MEGAANDGDINTTSTTSGVQITTLFRAFRLSANITTLSGNSVHNRSRVVRRWPSLLLTIIPSVSKA